MLGWALTFLIAALIAGALGFGSIPAAPVLAAKIIFVVFLILFIIAIVMHKFRVKAPPT